MENDKKEQRDKSLKTPNQRINPVLNDIISVLFLPAGLFLMLINPSMPKAYKIAIAILILIGALWIIYSMFFVHIT